MQTILSEDKTKVTFKETVDMFPDFKKGFMSEIFNRDMSKDLDLENFNGIGSKWIAMPVPAILSRLFSHDWVVNIKTKGKTIVRDPDSMTDIRFSNGLDIRKKARIVRWHRDILIINLASREDSKELVVINLHDVESITAHKSSMHPALVKLELGKFTMVRDSEQPDVFNMEITSTHTPALAGVVSEYSWNETKSPGWRSPSVILENHQAQKFMNGFWVDSLVKLEVLFAYQGYIPDDWATREMIKLISTIEQGDAAIVTFNTRYDGTTGMTWSNSSDLAEFFKEKVDDEAIDPESE